MAGYGNRDSGPSGARKQNKFRRQRRKVCGFCVDKTTYIDFKNAMKLKRYTSERGKIEPRRKTGTCAKHQRALATAIKRAREIALLPFVAD
ncbi:MAG: 30S ribosomal protein S18 [Capsulimonadaceae bacterium]|nr:30S ribosomal protein S18 [Capsulimonadaceae bacterium]